MKFYNPNLNKRQQVQKYPSRYFEDPDPFFEDHQDFRFTVDVTALEAMHHTQQAIEVCRDQFYYYLSSPLMSEVMARRPFSVSALITGLKHSLDTFTAKVAVAAAECRAAASEASTTLMGQLGVLDPRRPDLANRMPIVVDPLLEMRWQAREDALKAQIRQWHEKIMWKPEEMIEESTN